jgi:predicted dehydrogenase
VLDPARSGGHVLHNGVHLLDTVTWWMGERPHTVFARGRRQTTAQQTLDDHLELVLSFPGGGVAACEMSRAHRPARLAQRDVLVVGTEGTIAQPPGGDAGELADETGTAALPAVAGDAFARQLDAFLDAVEGGSALAGPSDGVFSIAMAVAAQRSIDSGEPVAIADVLPAGWDA